MSLTTFDPEDIKKELPDSIMKRIQEYMEVSNLNLSDAFQEALRDLADSGSLLNQVFMAGDYREYIPIAYQDKYLDFVKYPLRYQKKKEE